MAESFAVAAWSAMVLGFLTSISPCPLATNIAAISFIGKGVDHPGRVLSAGLLYTLGRSAAYLVLAGVIVTGILSTPAISGFLQGYMNKLLGPVLILVGMFLLELITLPGTGGGRAAGIGQRMQGWGVLGALPLGALFALSLCPISAAYFFGSLIPLAVKHGSRVALPLVFGVGTALPVIGFAFLIAFSARSVGQAFDRLKQFERWARLVTGVVFILAGIYYVLTYIFGVRLWG